MVTSEELNATFEKVGNDFHFDEVTAEFAPYRDLKVRWCRTMRSISFTVSDYLQDATNGVVEGIARAIFGRIRGEENVEYPEETIAWLTSGEFRDLNQEKYIERSRTIGDMSSEETGLLWEAYYRLVDAGLIPEVDGLRLFWSKNDSVAKAGQSSCLMKVVIMNKRLLKDNVPSEVLDFCLLHELANIVVGFGLNNIERKKTVSEISEGYEGASVAKRWLDQVMMEV
ncbi:MAG: hypothetical protein E7Z62_01800 [Thermoplasmata archaeon]|nr:hypothetical protein [Thermoplasmata archaeon]